MTLLSICIPTYNRSSYLQRTLQSIVKQDYFRNTDDVEIVISDNCSEDSTELISKEFVNLYPGKVIYYRNTFNTHEINFELSLSRGRGQYLKLNNDYLEHLDNSLEIILNEIRRNIKYKSNLFFMNGALGLNNTTTDVGKDRFLSLTSHYSTWIGMFGIWKSDFELLDDFNRSVNLQLSQFDNIYRILTYKPNFILIDTKIFKSAALKPRRNGDLLTIFVDNYQKVLSFHSDDLGIKPKTMSLDRKRVLLTFICGAAARASHGLEASFYVKHHWSRVFNYCRPNLIFFAHYAVKYTKNWLVFWYENKSRKHRSASTESRK